MFDDVLTRPGTEGDLRSLLDNAGRQREQKKDSERAALRRERDRLRDELAVGTEALTHAVQEAAEGVRQAREALRLAVEKRTEAERELRSFVEPIQRRISKAEVELLRRPISFLAPLRRKLSDAKRAIGTPRRWDPEKVVDPSYYRRADRLAELEREIEGLEEKNSAHVEALAKSIEASIADAIRN